MRATVWHEIIKKKRIVALMDPWTSLTSGFIYELSRLDDNDSFRTKKIMKAAEVSSFQEGRVATRLSSNTRIIPSLRLLWQM
jgi:hypothetical protein